MKFKVTPRDMIIFCIFCVFLLYFSALAVLNVISLINDGEFYGFNPIEGFSPKYIIGTLGVFFAVLAAIFFSVSASIFDRSKGIGITFGEKEEKGYSRWCKEKEMKKAYKVYRVGVKDMTAPAGGVVFINDGKNMWVDDGENHTLVIGVTGAGKTTAVVDPLIYSLCKHGESMVITDPKGEIYKNHAEFLKATGYNIVVLNFRQPNMGNAWNPLTLPYRLYKEGNIDKAVELVDDVALNILQDKKAQDPFWEKSASDYFSGCALGLLEDAKDEEEVNLNSISYMTTVGEDRFGAGSTYIKEYFKLKGESSAPYVFASNTINSPTETKGGILSVFRQKIRLFASREQLSEMLAYSNFDMRDIGKEKTAVFMVIHDEKTTYHALATIFIKQCYETLIDVAQSCGGKLPYRTNFILDEFANMPPLKDVTTMVTAARSRAIRFTFIIQNFAQLNEVYGKEDAETIRSNCGNLMYLLTTELSALEEISKLCGEVKSKKDEKTASQPLVTVSDLQKLKMNEVIIIRNRMHPFRTKLKPAYDIDWGDSQYGKAEFVEREKKEIKLFEIKEFVKVRSRSKTLDSLNDKKAPSFGGGDLASMMSGGLNGMSSPASAPKIPSFEEFMAARNAGKPDAMPANRPTMPSFNVDELVKKIDAKIAELEAQEQAEAKQKNTLNVNAIDVGMPQNKDGLSIEQPFIEKNSKPQTDILNTQAAETNNANIGKFFNTDVVNDGKDTVVTSPINAPVIDKPVQPNNIGRQPSDKIQTFEDLMQQNNPQMPERKPSIMISNPIENTNDLSVVNMPKQNVVNDTIQPKQEPTVKVDTDSKVIPPVSDDAFFDAFFDED